MPSKQCYNLPAHCYDSRSLLLEMLLMLPAYCQDKSLPRVALLLGRGGEFEKYYVTDPHVFAVQKAPKS